MSSEEISSPRTGKTLFDATRPFAKESRIKSWWYVGSTLVTLGAVLVLAAFIPWWPVRLCASVLGGLLFVRAFILFHDFSHGSLLHGYMARGSRRPCSGCTDCWCSPLRATGVTATTSTMPMSANRCIRNPVPSHS